MNEQTLKMMFSSKRQDWTTPQYIFDELNKEFSFTLDAASSDKNTKCDRHFTEEQNGLEQSWKGERVFINPPFGRGLWRWYQKAYQETRDSAEIVVMLVPARTDTSYWHDYAMKGEIRFIRGRLTFGDSKISAPFPSAIVIFRKPAPSGKQEK